MNKFFETLFILFILTANCLSYASDIVEGQRKPPNVSAINTKIECPLDKPNGNCCPTNASSGVVCDPVTGTWSPKE